MSESPAEPTAQEVVDELRLTVCAVLPREGPDQFSLNPSAAPPRNAFVPLRLLQAKLNQEKRVNAFLVAGAAFSLRQTEPLKFKSLAEPQETLGPKLMKEYEVKDARTLTSCNTCHR